MSNLMLTITTKFCRACITELPLASFNKDAWTRDGLRARCRNCDKSRKPLLMRAPSNKQNPEEHKESRKRSCKKYEKTKSGHLMRTYRNMKSRVLGIQKQKAHLYLGLYILDKEQFYAWSNKDLIFNELFDSWLKSGYDRKITPSIDRIDSNKGYEIGNIRWLTLSQNSSLGNKSRFSSRTSILV